MGFQPEIVMLKYVILVISAFSLVLATPVTQQPSCSKPSGTFGRQADWVYCEVDNAWYGISKKDNYDHFSAEFRLCAEAGGHVAWMNEQEEDSCAKNAMVETNTIFQYVVLSGDYQDEWVWPHKHAMTYYNWFPGSTSEGNCMGSFYDGTTYGWIQADCFQESKAMCRVNC